MHYTEETPLKLNLSISGLLDIPSIYSKGINITGVVEGVDGKMWLKDGKCHREDGPAKVYNDGRLSYAQNGKWHRLDGPAIITNDYKDYYIEGKKLYKKRI